VKRVRVLRDHPNLKWHSSLRLVIFVTTYLLYLEDHSLYATRYYLTLPNTWALMLPTT
jgi:hypothetical protein